MERVSFGTEGFRGIIGYDFNFQIVERIAKAIASYVVENGGKRIVVGYDTRFLSKEFAEHAASIASNHGVDAVISDNFCPSPVLSYATKTLGFNGGIMITASHNPQKYNGIKFKSHLGGAVSNNVTSRLTELIDRTVSENIYPGSFTKTIDLKTHYKRGIKKFIDKTAHGSKRLKIIIDPMYGAGQSILAEIIGSIGHDVIEIRNTINPSFAGTNPEPVEKNLLPLIKTVIDKKADLGIALDGDSDRIALVDARGRYVDAHKVFGLLLMYLAEELNLSKDVVKTVSGTEMVDKLCKHYRLNLHITKIGFKYICELMQSNDVMIGGEESGGIGIASHIPERDPLLASILIVQMMLKRKKSLDMLISDMIKITGKYYYRRKDLHMSDANNVSELIVSNKDKLLKGFGDYEMSDLDGYKFQFKDGGFLMVRASGTEPVLRIYTELNDVQKSNTMIEQFIGRLEKITRRHL